MPRSPVAVACRLVPRKIKEKELKPGDHICTDRNLYYHHGIYMGNDRVIHFTKVSKRNPPGENDKCHHYEDTTTDELWGVRKCCLKCFVRRKPGLHVHPHSLYIFEYGKWLTPFSIINTGGSHKKALPVEKVLKNAAEMLENEKLKYEMLEKINWISEMLVSENHQTLVSVINEMLVNKMLKCFGKYSLVLKNCETFAFYCKTESRYWFGSKQVLLAAALVVNQIVISSAASVVNQIVISFL